MNLHDQKMERKRKRREYEHRSTGEPLVLANLSRNHPHYGLSPTEHEAAKLNEELDKLLENIS